jgi:hypothetical protein
MDDRYGQSLTPGAPVLAWKGDPDDIEDALSATYLGESDEGRCVVQLDPLREDPLDVDALAELFAALHEKGIDPQTPFPVDHSAVALYGPPEGEVELRLPAPVVEAILQFHEQTGAAPPGLISLLDRAGVIEWSDDD